MIARILIAFLLFASPAMAWEVREGPVMPGEFYSVGPYIPGLGVPVGQYGGGRIMAIDPLTAGVRSLGILPVGDDHESVSAFQAIDGVGLNAWTEHDGGAGCWTAWEKDGWRWTHTQTFSPWPWALGGPSMTKQGWMSLNEGRKGRVAGGWVAKWLDRWQPITPVIPGVIIWDAAPWQGGMVLGCSTGTGKYLEEWAGRLVFVKDGGYRFVDIPSMAGILRVAAPSETLYLTTTWGEVWKTSDLEGFERVHDADYGFQRNAFLFELDGKIIIANATGKVWVLGEGLVVDIPDVDFMSLSPAGGCLAGPLTRRGRSRAVVVCP